MVKYLKDQNTFINDLEGGVNVDSDCEGDSTRVGDGVLKKEDDEGETRAVLIAGSFSAYVRSPPHPGTEGITNSTVGNLFSSITAQTRFHSLPSNRKASTLA